ncbi:MAG: class I SAM-dependent methyltransferase [Thermodesulfobacteriota bacterium]|nr:class I SAM-dependent methyltransferase [Thermodesulfobacteriota bacterium]
MKTSEYNFKRCKLCGEITAEPLYDLTDGIIYSCQRCDFHFLNRLDARAEKGINTPQLNSVSRNYIESRIDENAHLHPQRLEFVQKHINLSNCKALDIGAGLGQFLLLLQTHEVEVQGIEPSAIRREYAQEKFGINLRGELVGSDYWQTEFSRYFDLITLWDVIEHVDFPRETLQAAIKLLKPGGFLFLDTPSRDVLPYKLSQKFYRFSSGKISLFLPSFYSSAPFGHKQIFTLTQLSGLFQDLGLEICYKAKSYRNNPERGSKIILAGKKNIGAQPQSGHDQSHPDSQNLLKHLL